MKQSKAGRRNARFAVQWPLIYGTDELIGNGTLLDLSALGGRVVGTMPVEPGMHLWLRLSPQHRSDEVRIEKARVTWVRNHEFGIELKGLSPADHYWLMKFLERAERRSTFNNMPKFAPSDEELSLRPLSLPVKD
jgi:hypothetical protein